MFSTKFGIEIEFTGITRERAAEVAQGILNGQKRYAGTYYGTWEVTQADGRVWKFMSDSSINCQVKRDGRLVSVGKDYSVELVSPILTYDADIETLLDLVRALRKAGGFAGGSTGTGIHIHLGSEGHTVRSLKNFLNIMASKNDLIYKALDVPSQRMRFCQKIDKTLIEKIQKRNPKTMKELEDIWYDGFYDNRESHYNSSRYSALNYHCLFHGNGSLELRFFNSTLSDCRVIRAYILLALCLNHQALTQRCASAKKSKSEENEKFTMRCFLIRIGLGGKEYAYTRKVLTEKLSGNSAWRFHTAA